MHLIAPLVIFSLTALPVFGQPQKCTARIRALDATSTWSERALTYHGVEVLDAGDCNELSKGDLVHVVTLDGRVGAVGQIVTGAPSLVEGQEASVVLEQTADKDNARLLLQIDSNEDGTVNRPAYLCTRVPVSGPSLFWPTRKIVVHPTDPPAKSTLSREELTEGIQWAAKQWSDPECSDLSLDVGEPSSQKWIGYNWLSKQNQNVVTIRQDNADDPIARWIHFEGALALTTVTFLYHSGEILDADVELNGSFFEFADCGDKNKCESANDLKNTLTHELGHVLGLNHPPISIKGAKDTTMFAASPPGDTSKRDLAQGDIDGLCRIYPKGQQVGECFGVERKEPPPVKVEVAPADSCQQSAATTFGPAFFALTLLLFRTRKPTGKRQKTSLG